MQSIIYAQRFLQIDSLSQIPQYRTNITKRIIYTEDDRDDVDSNNFYLCPGQVNTNIRF